MHGIHKYLTSDWMVLCFCKACIRYWKWPCSDSPPFDSIPLEKYGSNLDSLFHLIYVGIIFLPLYCPHFQPAWPSHSLPLNIHLQLLRDAFGGRAERFTQHASWMLRSHPTFSFKTLPWIYHLWCLHPRFASLHFSSMWQLQESLQRLPVCPSVGWTMPCCYSHCLNAFNNYKWNIAFFSSFFFRRISNYFKITFADYFTVTCFKSISKD